MQLPLVEDLGVGAEHRCAAVQARGRRPRSGPGRPRSSVSPATGIGDPGDEAGLLHVRVGEDLAERVDRPARDAARAQLGEPVLTLVAREPILQQLLRARTWWITRSGWRGEARVVEELRPDPTTSATAAQSRSLPAATVNVAVGCGEALVRRVARVGRAEPLRLPPGAPVLAGLQGRDAEQAVEHRARRAAPRRPCRATCGSSAATVYAAYSPADEVADRDAGLRRAAVGEPGHAHQPGHPLDDDVVGAVVDVGAGQPVAGDRAVDEPRMPLARRCRSRARAGRGRRGGSSRRRRPRPTPGHAPARGRRGP